MSFGERLQALRRGSGMTQEEFAQQLKVSRQAVSKWESSRGYPEIEKIIYICNRYQVSMDELFRDEVPPIRHAPASEEQDLPTDQALKSPPLKKAFSNFFTNLSPQNQLLFWTGLALTLIVLLILFCTNISKGGSDQMVWKLIWLGLLILFAAGEGITVGLTSIWFAAGSLAALIVALLDGPLGLQIALFIIVSLLCLLAVRPLAKKYLNPKVQATNADRVIGMEARVTEDIDNIQGKGAVSVGGAVWTARSDGDAVIPAGSRVTVLRIEGVKVFVELSKEEAVCRN